MKTSGVPTSRLHHRTPALSAIDGRGLKVVSVSYLRAQASDDPEPHFYRQRHDAAGRSVAQWDARLWADGGEAGRPNLSSIHSLSDDILRTDSADAGWRIALLGHTGNVMEGWDSRGTRQRSVYDDQLRAVSQHETLAGAAEACVERFSYGGSSESATNRCGGLLRHDDPAGSLTVAAHTLSGQLLAHTQRFLASTETPDWPSSVAERDALLENGGVAPELTYATRWHHDPTGTLLHQVDAVGNMQSMRFDVAGQLLEMSVRLGGAALVVLLRNPAYNAFGHVIGETAGNDVVTTVTCSDVDGQVQLMEAVRPGKVLQCLRYTYDPTGNITGIEDAAQPTDWFAGAQIDPVSHYRHDTLYRLVEASGRESVLASIRPGLPDPGGPGGGADASRLRQYTQTYAYDAGGNLSTLRHASGGQTLYTRTMVVDARSNRSLPTDAGSPPDFARAFDARGNLMLLEGTQAMSWDARNQLRRVTQIIREDGASDDETYVYDSGGQRRRKIRSTQGTTPAQSAEVRYLPGLEIRSDTATGETVHIAVIQAGRHQVRHFRWLARYRALPPPQWRYGLNDHLGGSVLELDDHGEVISHEGYYPYGGTSYRAAHNQVEATFKTIRYSGKERDATGLYCYGRRYLAPWLCRWVSPDPAGDIDGLNVYEFVGSDPIGHVDPSGQAREDAFKNWQRLSRKATRPISVHTVVPGIVAVSVTGNAEVFASLGFHGLSTWYGPRTLDYLAIDPATYEGIVSGGDARFNPLISKAEDFASYSGAHQRTMAHINGTYYNIQTAADDRLPDHASIGPAVSNRGRLPHTAIPSDYASHYRKITLGQGTSLHAAPALTEYSGIVFQPADNDPLFLYQGDQRLVPGRLHHAQHPNARSGISLPSPGGNGGLARMAVGSQAGSRGDHAVGYTLQDWAIVMQRLDRLDDNAREDVAFPHDSTNLDGGTSSLMGVIDATGKRLYGVSQNSKGKGIATSITFRQRRAAVAASSPQQRTGSGRCCSIV